MNLFSEEVIVDNRTLLKKLILFQFAFIKKQLLFMSVFTRKYESVDYDKYPYILKEKMRAVYILFYLIVFLPSVTVGTYLRNVDIPLAISTAIIVTVWITSTLFAFFTCLIYLYLTHKKKV